MEDKTSWVSEWQKGQNKGALIIVSVPGILCHGLENEKSGSGWWSCKFMGWLFVGPKCFELMITLPILVLLIIVISNVGTWQKSDIFHLTSQRYNQSECAVDIWRWLKWDCQRYSCTLQIDIMLKIKWSWNRFTSSVHFALYGKNLVFVLCSNILANSFC
jgi:hypothetical protein